MHKEVEVIRPGDLMESIDVYKLGDIVEDEVQALVDYYGDKL